MTLFAPPPPPVRSVSLIKLSSEIARSLAVIGRVAVEGEIHNVRRRPNGRIYLTLKDRAAQVSVQVPGAKAKRARIADGERVQVTGKLEWNNGWGQLHLIADEVAPVGEGAIAAAIADARERLRADGLLDRPRRTIPRLPRAVGVVCGSDAAVRHDIESVATARFPGLPLVFREVTVSGPGAAESIRWALEDLAASDGIEVVILARGGGDATQLLPFSDEELCRAICAVPVAVVSAVGHENDRPLCDEVVDMRCGTPSMAAAEVVPEESVLKAEVAALRDRAEAVVRSRVERAGDRLGAVDRVAAVRAGVERATLRHERIGLRLASLHPRQRMPAERERLLSRRREMEALNPRRVLQRGYAVVWDASGRAVRDPAAVRRGDLLDIDVAVGRLRARAEPS